MGGIWLGLGCILLLQDSTGDVLEIGQISFVLAGVLRWRP